MLENISDGTFFHLNSNANGSLHSPMMVGDIVQVGSKSNPFFAFLENLSLTYQVTNSERGTVENIPALTFLRRVEGKNITTSALPAIAFHTAKCFLHLAREMYWEKVRHEEFPEAPSRQRGIWLVRTYEDAKRWANHMGWHPAVFRIVRVTASGRALNTDGNRIPDNCEPLAIWHEKAQAYWMGKDSDQPLPEVLFEGTLRVEEIMPFRDTGSDISGAGISAKPNPEAILE
ncbi:MAG: DUF2441 domain-containing protein [Fimbriimonadaceae bacterium]|uniref:DUF2441 domain-containing protein n=1 Tax=Nitrosomonas sp. TaxID=42353 RepID=UPI001E0B4DB6|nr:DUF2441 domain-containing protein [Nitrosomonas sp.]MBX3120962.1 DUF2441 domain-containing protein [Fimbriimonadaceae bacterium]MBX3618280.1 DUF2441 domain-containing protein [Nitrosomonas sp.]